MTVIHAPGQQEHSLCGLAFDAYDSGNYEEPVILAQHGQTVTCEQCREHIDYIRNSFKRYKYIK